MNGGSLFSSFPSSIMALNISHLIAADAPLLTITDDESLFSPTEPFDYGFYSLPPSPPLSDQPSPLRTPDPEPVCFPTHQVFDLDEVTCPSTPSSVSAQSTTITPSTDSIVPTGSKRSASPAPPVAKKRAVGERVASKDFVPPDVTGLSKREARLVKNRAAAFLSRQRKREEFECMEIRVAELEQENKRLLALTQQNPSQAHSSAAPSDTASEVESLKAQLAAAQERTQSLSAQLEQRNEANSSPVIKVESRDDLSTEPPASSPPRSTGLASAHKSSASLGLMVLLCALPSLLSMRIQSPASATNIDDLFAVSNTFHASGGGSAFDFDFDNSMFAPNEFDWSYSKSSSFMDLDVDRTNKMTSTTRKLEFTGIDSLEGETGLRNLGDLDISFDTAPSDDGKIRVRIHPTSCSPSSASSRSVSRGTTPEGEDSSMSTSPSSTSSPRSRPSPLGVGSLSALSTTSNDPFLGITSPSETDDIDMMMNSYIKDENSISYGSRFDEGSSFLWSLSSSLSSLRGEPLDSLNNGGTVHGKRRVRIALKSAPQAASEGGEWEVQIC